MNRSCALRPVVVAALVLGAAPARAVFDACEGGGVVAGVVTAEEVDVRIEGRGASAALGTSVAVGDFNGDGVGDLALAAPNAKVNNISRVGVVYVFFGPLPADPLTVPEPGANLALAVDDPDALVITMPTATVANADTRIGTALAVVPATGAGEADGLLIGSTDNKAWMVHDLGAASGPVDLLAAPGAGPGVWARWEMTGAVEFGTVMTVISGTPGSTTRRAVIGAPADSVSASNAGAVWVFDTASSGVFTAGAEVAVIRSNVASHRFGTSLTAGCFSSSGAEDLVVGSNVAAGAQATFGEVRVFGASSLSGAVSAVTGAQSRVYGGAGVRLGAAVLVADLDGDGAGELIASSPTTGSQRGKVYAIPCASLPTGGASASIANLPAATFSETVANRNLGASLAAGDVDRDGVDELIAGAPGFGATSATDGAARVLELVAGALSPMGLVTGRTGKEGAHGAALAVGDCNGDGWDDVVVGARKENVDEPVPPGGLATLAEGQVYLYLGGSADTEDVVTRYVDLDEDGFGTTAVEVCPSELGANDAAVDGDCDDAAAAINPTATEVCDGIDNNCDGQTDEGLLLSLYEDLDGDGFGSAQVWVCAPAAGLVELGQDCDDADPGRSPGEAEIVNDGLDQDCADGDACQGDADGDGFGGLTIIASADLDCDDPGEAADSDDCEDTLDWAYPGALDITGDEVDADCDGLLWCFVDGDEDGWNQVDPLGFELIVVSETGTCTTPGYGDTTTQPGDCDDAQPAVNPAATEVCDEVDNDCDAQVDDGVQSTWYADSDGDGFGAAAVLACVQPPGTSAVDADCDDASAAVFPGATEGIGDAVDDDCDGSLVCFVDVDDDGYAPEDEFGAPALIQVAAPLDCTGVELGDDTTLSGDCDDNDAAISPGDAEVVGDEHHIDEDCDGMITCYVDEDDDHFAPYDATGAALTEAFVAGSSCLTSVSEVGPGAGDCDDADDLIRPDATERCNQIDDDCDGTVDDGLAGLDGAPLWFADSDADGFGDGASPGVESCAPVPGHVLGFTDMMDSDGLVGENTCDASLGGAASEAPERIRFEDTTGSIGGSGGIELAVAKLGLTVAPWVAVAEPSRAGPGAQSAAGRVTVHEVGPASRSYNTSAAIALPGGPVQASVSGDVSNRRLGELVGFADLSWEEDDGGSVIEVPPDGYDELIISENHGGDLHLLVYDLAARVEYRKAMHGLGADDASLVLILPGWAADAGHSFAVDDLDADGSADLIIGDPDRLSNQGCVQIAWGPFHGVAAPPNDVPVETLSTLTELCGAANERIGKSVATGDFDGDAYRDLAIGADREYVGAPHARAYVVFGDAICGAPDCSGRLEGELLPIGASALRLESTSGLSRLGDMVRVLGDVNGDGADDLAVGSRSVSGLRVFVLSGTALASATSTWTVPAVSTPGAVAVITGNSRVETVGDLTGDGLAELAVARPDDGSNSGIVRVFYGATGFFGQTSNLNYTCVDSQSCGSLGGKALTQSLPEAKWGMAVLGAPVMAPGVNDLIALGDQWDDGSGIERWVVDVVPWSNPFARLTCPTGP